MRLTWNDRRYSDGVDRVAVYTPQDAAYPWSGVTSLEEQTNVTPDLERYLNGRRYVVPAATEDFSFSVESFTYPPILETPRMRFGITYRTREVPGARIHLAYNCTPVPGSKAYKTTESTLDPTMMSWDIYTTPVDIPEARPAAHLIADPAFATEGAMSELEDLLYGTPNSPPSFPDPGTVIAIFESYSSFIVIDHGDGTWSAIGSASQIQQLTPTTFQISVPTAIQQANNIFSLSNYDM